MALCQCHGHLIAGSLGGFCLVKLEYLAKGITAGFLCWGQSLHGLHWFIRMSLHDIHIYPVWRRLIDIDDLARESHAHSITRKDANLVSILANRMLVSQGHILNDEGVVSRVLNANRVVLFTSLAIRRSVPTAQDTTIFERANAYDPSSTMTRADNSLRNS